MAYEIKHYLKFISPLFLWALSFSSHVNADSPIPLSLKDAMISATQTHPTVTMKRKEYEASLYSVDAAEWQRFPSFSVTTSNSPLSTTPVTILTIDQPIWSGGRITANIESSRAKSIVAAASIFEAEQSILVKTVSAFSEILRLQSRVLASNENIEEHQRLLALIERRSNSQISPESEVTMAIARLQQAKSELVQLQTQLVNARADLEQLISMPVGQLRVPAFNLDFDKNFEQVLSQVMAYSPRLNRLHYEVIASDHETDLKRSNLMPQVSIRHQDFYGGNYPGNTTFLAVTFQPGNGLSSFSNIKESESKRDAAESNVDVAKKELADDLRTAWFKVESSRAEKDIYSKLVEATRSQYESSVRLYAAGRKGWLEVLNFRKEATQAKYQSADSEWGGFFAMMKIKINTGTVNEFMNISSMDR
ncbi:TolC family protein [Candidatus Methylopumilus turicensis]|uniref:Putative Outer membrane efflux protein n=1 Tax=Candidatus Methylopumilus turicensis TaxID=1581680 RepID=A0A0B7IYR2_9PROT|nr:TolC family protein [Candidatus Methylopumilus turicensis]CEN56209.1 putative Outer membrane efflux protein [Candidatus Methylopumilus turicensis]